MNDFVKIISIRDVERLVLRLKSGNIYKIVSRLKGYYNTESFQQSYILNIKNNEWFKPEKNSIAFILDNNPMKQVSKYIDNIARPLHISPIPQDTNLLHERDYRRYATFYFKILYEDQICLIHAGWLEEI